MDKTRTAVSLPETQPVEEEAGVASAAMREQLRSLSDFELWLVGGGEEVPHW